VTRQKINSLIDDKYLDYARKKIIDKAPRELNIVDANKIERKLKGVLPDEFERIIQLASQRVNIMLSGPAGCGKTYIAAKAAEGLGLTFGSISCSAGMSESQLAGWLLPTGKGGQFEYKPSTFVELYEKGGLFLLDEMDSADPNALTFINSALANEGFHVPQRLGDTYIKKHKDFVCIAAANTFGTGADEMYIGRNPLDAATLDRFRVGMIRMDYSDAVEEALVDPSILKWGRAIRDNINAHKLRRVMSTRVMLDLDKMAKAYDWGQEDWEQSYFAGWSADEVIKAKLQGAA